MDIEEECYVWDTKTEPRSLAPMAVIHSANMSHKLQIMIPLKLSKLEILRIY